MSAGDMHGVCSTAVAKTGSLPYVDEHSTVVEADAEDTWAALLEVVENSFSFAGARYIARILGCEQSEDSGPRPLAEGSSCPGFKVVSAMAPGELALAGRHRFSRYTLTFRLEGLGEEATRLRAETRAEFPGYKGRFYRALVIGTRGHVAVTRSLLAATGRRAGSIGSEQPER